jgi:hypothetical protein
VDIRSTQPTQQTQGNAIVEQKKLVQNKFFDTIKGVRNLHTAKNKERPQILFPTHKFDRSGHPAIFMSKKGLAMERPKTTKIKRVRGRNAFKKFGVTSKRKETRRRFEENNMLAFNYTHIGSPNFGAGMKLELSVSNAVFRN